MGKVLNQAVDVTAEYGKLENQCFVAGEVVDFDPACGKGRVRWKRHGRKPRMAFDQIVTPIEETKSWEFPPEYEKDPVLPFEVASVTHALKPAEAYPEFPGQGDPNHDHEPHPCLHQLDCLRRNLGPTTSPTRDASNP
jgi:hypothetical protein